MAKSVIERIREKIDLPDDWESGLSTVCWNWTGWMHKCGGKLTRIPRIEVDGRKYSARRLWDGGTPRMWRMTVTCGNDRCMNPSHFKRLKTGFTSKTGAKGGRGKRSISPRSVIDIRMRYADGTVLQRELAQEYGCLPGTIGRIVRKEAYQEIKGPKTVGRRRRGEYHTRATLTTTQVIRIIELHQQGRRPWEIRDFVHATKDQIFSILQGRSWSWLTGIQSPASPPMSDIDTSFLAEQEALIQKHWQGGRSA